MADETNTANEEPQPAPATKDVNENVSDLTYEEKVQFVEREVQTLLQFCISKGFSDKDLALCVDSFTGEVRGAKGFYKTNAKFLFTLGILAVVGAVAFGWEPAYNKVCVHARLFSLKLLPIWDWSALFNEECLVNNPYMKEKKITEEDCLVCLDNNKNGIERVKNANLDDIAQNFLFVANPAIILDATKNWPGTGNLTLNHLFELYKTHEDLQGLGDCTFIGSSNDWKNVYEFIDFMESGGLEEDELTFMFLENCNQKASKVIRRFYGRPYFLPQSTEVSRFNQIYIAKGMDDIEREKEEQPLVEQDSASGTWIAVVSGRVQAMLYPEDECKSHGCRNITLYIETGQALLIPHEIYKFKMVPSYKGVTIAVSSSLNWDER